jgi:hypothetical protein
MSQTKHTMFASQAIGLAELFKFTIGRTKLEGPVNYVPELSAPEGESTAGGKQALQHVSLVAEGGGARLVIGSANTVDKHAELRTYAHVVQIFKQRFKSASFDVDQSKYDKLLDQVRAFFAERGFQVSISDPPPPPAARPATATATAAAPASGRSPLPLIVGVALMVVIVAVIVLAKR